MSQLSGACTARQPPDGSMIPQSRHKFVVIGYPLDHGVGIQHRRHACPVSSLTSLPSASAHSRRIHPHLEPQLRSSISGELSIPDHVGARPAISQQSRYVAATASQVVDCTCGSSNVECGPSNRAPDAACGRQISDTGQDSRTLPPDPAGVASPASFNNAPAAKSWAPSGAGTEYRRPQNRPSTALPSAGRGGSGPAAVQRNQSPIRRG